jgi:carbamoyltransferase
MMSEDIYILGISAFYHDSAACILRNGDIVAAAQEERFTRIKHDASFPAQAIQYCLQEAKISPSQIKEVVFYENPSLKMDRLFKSALAYAPAGLRAFRKSFGLWLSGKGSQRKLIAQALEELFGSEIGFDDRIVFSEHHISHAASAFYASPFQRAAILTLDGVGEWATTSVAVGHDTEINVLKEIRFPHSLGLLYSTFTYYSGFKVNSGEYKLMGLAPYGEPIYESIIKEHLLEIADDGSFQLNMTYFDFVTGKTMTNKKFEKLFGGLPRSPEAEVTKRDMDLAASIQKVTEEIVTRIARHIAKETGERNLCLAGGVALNCVANGKLLREKIFEDIWIQPAAGDAGGALGAALFAWNKRYAKKRSVVAGRDSMNGAFLGPSYTDSEVESTLSSLGAVFEKLDEKELISQVSAALITGKAIGWVQGRMEFGPRSLGGRSILADPRSPFMQKQLNLKVKYRESFRPFAPSVLREKVSDWFEIDTDSPYMLLVADVQTDKRRMMTAEEELLFGIEKLNIPRSVVPAVTHVDYSSRIQTVHQYTNPRFHALILKFEESTGVPLVVNTSFNVRGEPIVCSPSDAFKCFMGTELDVLAIGNFLLWKSKQNPAHLKRYERYFELD